MPRRPDWTLYIDESGRFEDLSESVVVAGLLLHSGVSTAGDEAVLARLGELAPEPLWPWHAAVLHVPVSFALGAVAEAGAALTCGRPPGCASVLIHAEARAVAEACERRAGSSWRGCLQRVVERRAPEVEHLRRLNRVALSCEPRAYEKIQNASVCFRRVMQGTLRRIADEGNAGGDWPLAMMVAAGESVDGDGAETPFLDEGPGDRYLGLLACVLGRTACLLARRGGGERLHIEALNRQVSVRTAKGERKRFLAGHTVRALYELVTHGLENAPPLAGEPVARSYTPSMPPQLVLADYVSNRARRKVATDQRLSATLRSLANTTALPSCSGAPDARSHLAATGVAWSYVRRAWQMRERGRDPAGLGDAMAKVGGPRLWALEQALQWA